MAKRMWVVMSVLGEDSFDGPLRFFNPALRGFLPVYHTKAAAEAAHPGQRVIEVTPVEAVAREGA